MVAIRERKRLEARARRGAAGDAAADDLGPAPGQAAPPGTVMMTGPPAAPPPPAQRLPAAFAPARPPFLLPLSFGVCKWRLPRRQRGGGGSERHHLRAHDFARRLRARPETCATCAKRRSGRGIASGVADVRAARTALASRTLPRAFDGSRHPGRYKIFDSRLRLQEV